MRGLVAALLALIVAVALALFLKEDVGYVLISYGHWTVEASLALFILLDIVLFAGLYFALRAFFRIRGMPKNVQAWRTKKSISKAQQTLTQGLVDLAEGNWLQAEKRLLSRIKESETPLLNYLAAARAAQLQGAYERRDQYLQQAHESMPSADIAVGLTQAELQLAHHQHEQALATLNHLRSLAPKHAYVLKLLAEHYETLGEWSNLQQLLPELRKRKIEPQETLRARETKIHVELMRGLGRGDDVARLTGYWRNLPSAIRNEPNLMQAYAHALIDAEDNEGAATVLIALLGKEWRPELVTLYGDIETQDAAKQLATAEGWLTTHQKDAGLLLTLARLSLRNKLWGKARSYLEASIGIKPTPMAYYELGALLETMDELDEATQCYRSGLKLVAENRSSVELEAECADGSD